MHWIVCDIDGVLADCRHRLHFIKDRPKDYKAFYGAVADDSVFDIGYLMLAGLEHEEPYDGVLLLTGRSEECRADTLQWLRDNGICYEKLIMRPEGDYRPAEEFKLDILNSLHGIDLVIDDDPDVCRTLVEQGYTVIQPLWGRS